MKIGLLTASLSRQGGGIFHALCPLSHSLHRPPEVDVAVFGLQDDATATDSAAWEGLDVTAAPTRGPRQFGFSRDLDLALAEADLDLLHIHGLWTYTSVASRRWADATARPYVITPHGMLDPWAVRNSRWKKILARLLYESAHLRGAACLHALCEGEAQAMRNLGLRNPICVIPNAVELPSGSPTPTASPVVAGAADGPILLYLGRLHPKKGLIQLLNGWRIARDEIGEKMSRWQLVLAGWDQDRHEAELKQLCSALGVARSVHFVGPVFGAKKHALLRAAAALVLPSVSEGLPLAVLEAWSYARPVLLTPECHLSEGIRAGAAISVEPTPLSIAAGIVNLISMPASGRTAMGERGLALLKQRFILSRVVHEIEEVYRWLLAGGPRPGCILLH
jgi:glycosyltransferase involved in cell wall biosynthesis